MLLDEEQKPILEVRTVVSETRKLEDDGYDYVERRMLRAASAAALQAAAAAAGSSEQQVTLECCKPCASGQGCLCCANCSLNNMVHAEAIIRTRLHASAHKAACLKKDLHATAGSHRRAQW